MTDLSTAPGGLPIGGPPLTFMFRGRLTSPGDVSPTLTVLQWLRTHARATGTREGCAEGDCGACTVMIGVPQAGELRWMTADACLVFLPMLHGCELLTVEDLKGLAGGGALHPVQEAMVETAGSQCGFCTPGFVMSLMGLYAHRAPAERGEVELGISGNLCRCTGYRPITDAGVKALSEAPSRPALQRAWEERSREHAHLLGGIYAQSLTHEGAGGSFWRPTRLEEATDRLGREPGVELLSGGTDLGLEITKRRRELPRLLYLGAVQELQEVELEGPTWRFGAGVSYTRWLPLIKERLPALHEMFMVVGSPQIRNLGTVGGNLATASPIGDSAPALLAYDARVELASRAGVREVPLREFFTAYRRTLRRPDELISALLIPAPPPGAFARTYKISRRVDMDISASSAVFYVERDGEGRVVRARSGFGGVAATPMTCPALDQLLVGRALDEATLEEASALLAGAFNPISDHRGSAEYRRLSLVGALRRFFNDASGGQP